MSEKRSADPVRGHRRVDRPERRSIFGTILFFGARRGRDRIRRVASRRAASPSEARLQARTLQIDAGAPWHDSKKKKKKKSGARPPQARDGGDAVRAGGVLRRDLGRAPRLLFSDTYLVMACIVMARIVVAYLHSYGSNCTGSRRTPPRSGPSAFFFPTSI